MMAVVYLQNKSFKRSCWRKLNSNIYFSRQVQIARKGSRGTAPKYWISWSNHYCLRSRIRPDSSKVVAGRIAALKVKSNDFQDFAKQAEELTEPLERSLVFEGITKENMAVEQTVSVCRLNSKSVLVKSTLASSPMNNEQSIFSNN